MQGILSQSLSFSFSFCWQFKFSLSLGRYYWKFVFNLIGNMAALALCHCYMLETNPFKHFRNFNEMWKTFRQKQNIADCIEQVNTGHANQWHCNFFHTFSIFDRWSEHTHFVLSGDGILWAHSPLKIAKWNAT